MIGSIAHIDPYINIYRGYIYNLVVYLKERYNIYNIGDDDDVKVGSNGGKIRESKLLESARAYIYGTIHQYTSI